jgi:hypothetical protein
MVEMLAIIGCQKPSGQVFRRGAWDSAVLVAFGKVQEFSLPARLLVNPVLGELLFLYSHTSNERFNSLFLLFVFMR